jgi:hypothetical protein
MRKYTLHKPGAKPAPLQVRPIATAKHAGDAGCPDGSWKPLSKEQKMRLAILARKAAWEQKLGLDSKQLEAWRQEVSIRACGLRISEASQCHWADLKSAFEDLAGDSVAAYQTQLRDGDNKRRVALWKLGKALEEKGLQPEYAGAICRMQFKCALEDASAKQLWCLFYTVTNRGKKS